MHTHSHLVPPRTSNTELGTYIFGTRIDLPIPIEIGPVTLQLNLTLYVNIYRHGKSSPFFSNRFVVREGLVLPSFSSDDHLVLHVNNTSLSLQVNPFNITCTSSLRFEYYLDGGVTHSTTIVSFQCCKYCICVCVLVD